jgi:hypothetical protein
LSGVCAATSTPAEKALPSPLITTLEIRGCASISDRVRVNSSIIATSMTFRGELDKTMRATGAVISAAIRVVEATLIGRVVALSG